MDREQWLQERRTGIGGSDAAAACGLHPIVSPYELWLDKTASAVLEREDTERMQMGRALEDAIAAVYAERFGVKLRRHNAIRRHPKYDWMLANPDRLIEGAKTGVEIKNVDALVYRFSQQWGEENTDEVPEPYLLQCQHYCAVFGFDEWHLGALIGGNTLKRYIVRRDVELEQMLIESEHEFWQTVQKREPPAMDYNRPNAIRLLRQLYPGTNGETIDLPEEALHWHRVRAEAAARAKTYEATVDGASAHLLHLMGDAALGVLPGGGSYRRKEVKRKGYTVEPMEYIDFRYVKPKGQEDE
ncbi:YqaJ viral recombinase family protein [Paraburkholderia sp. RL18-103-BIB-C]|uniref:YqaJ viral recombinase family nuclease n=1 Tax=Paraburkholderia sp. RL18-103-BIB-C TaxID=3031637 RepID=UPI0038B75FE3